MAGVTTTQAGNLSPETTAPEAQPTVRVAGLRKGYREGTSRHSVLESLSFDVRPGECVALLGRSGSGKSTLLNLLAGIDRPDEGRIELLGAPITDLTEPALTLLRRRCIGFVYQFFNLIPTLTVAENLALPLELNRTPVHERRSRTRALLTRLGLDRRANAFPDQLSGGEQQRVAIGRALIHEPALVLADEPTGNLDAETGERVLALLAEVFRERGRAMILVTHSLAVSRIADRVLTLEQGRLIDAAPGLSW